MKILANNHVIIEELSLLPGIKFVLFGLRLNLASHLERSSLSRSYGWDSADDRSSCFASFTLIPESFVQYAGQ
jgi:hypothetical protein